MSGLIHLYCGNGKGKTSLAMGTALRCAGNGEHVLIAQFLKTNNSGEIKSIVKVPGITFIPNDKTFGFTWDLTEEEKQEEIEYIKNRFDMIMNEINTNRYGMLVLDEIIDACEVKMLPKEQLITFLKSKPKELEVVMTGHNPDEDIISLASYYSNIEKVKHPYDDGVEARKGIEF